MRADAELAPEPPVRLADVATSAAAAIGVPGFVDVLGLGSARQVVVCLIDGLGWNSLRASVALAPTMGGLSGGPIDAMFPTTTPVGLGSLGTGLSPGRHGLVGASFTYPETGEVLAPLKWGSDPTPVAVQPEPTVFEAVARSGRAVRTISPAAYRESGLTRAVLRGGEYVAAEGVADRVDALASALAIGEPSFSYVYWPPLDRIGHEFGVDSPQWRAALADADTLVARLVEVLPPGATMVVTADHGMVDSTPADRIWIEDDRDLTADVTQVAGEPRMRHVYARDGAAADVRTRWRERLAGRAQVLSRQEAVAAGLFGAVDPALADRIGDVIAIPVGTTVLASATDRLVSGLVGQHGALTSDEVRVPALVVRG